MDPDDVTPVADYFGFPELCEKFEAMKKPVVTENNNDADIIRLNVGGTIFETTRATLTQDRYSKLAKMFTPGSETSPPRTKDGAYFIDGCPKAAEVILNWLRNGSPHSIYVSKNDLVTADNLKITANKFWLYSEAKPNPDYYGISYL